MKRLGLIVFAAVLASCPLVLQAQSFSFSGGGLYASLSGSDFQGTNAGIGPELQFRYHAASGFSIGGGVQYTSHDVDGISENYGVTGFFVEPRYAFQVQSSSIHPYLGARLALLNQKIEVSGIGKVTGSGTAFGASGGILLRLASAARLDIGVTWAKVSFGDAELDGTTIPDSDASGSALALRAAVVFQFGKK